MKGKNIVEAFFLLLVAFWMRGGQFARKKAIIITDYSSGGSLSQSLDLLPLSLQAL